MSWLMSVALLASLVAPVSRTKTLSDADYKEFVRQCNEGVFVACVRRGTGWLQFRKLTLNQRYGILFRVAEAYTSLGRNNDAEESLKKAIKLAPCRKPPSGIKNNTLQLFKIVQKSIFQADQSPPILTHISPPPSQFRSDGKMEVKATDDLQIRDITLFYRTKATGEYRSLSFTFYKDTRYRVTVPKKELDKIKRFHYYIVARNCANRTATNEADASQPVKLVFVGKASSAKAIGGGLLIAVGAAVFVGASLLFLNADIESQKLKNITDKEKAKPVQERIALFQGLAWGGIALGVLAIAGGVWLLLPPGLFKKKKKADATSSRTLPPPGTNSTILVME